MCVCLMSLPLKRVSACVFAYLCVCFFLCVCVCPCVVAGGGAAAGRHQGRAGVFGSERASNADKFGGMRKHLCSK